VRWVRVQGKAKSRPELWLRVNCDARELLDDDCKPGFEVRWRRRRQERRPVDVRVGRDQQQVLVREVAAGSGPREPPAHEGMAERPMEYDLERVTALAVKYGWDVVDPPMA
jgi:hypothetical protein